MQLGETLSQEDVSDFLESYLMHTTSVRLSTTAASLTALATAAGLDNAATVDLTGPLPDKARGAAILAAMGDAPVGSAVWRALLNGEVPSIRADLAKMVLRAFLAAHWNEGHDWHDRVSLVVMPEELREDAAIARILTF